MDEKLRLLERCEDQRRYKHTRERALGDKKLSSNERWLLKALGHAPLIDIPKPKSNGEDYWIFLISQSRWATLDWRNLPYLVVRFMKSRALSYLLLKHEGPHLFKHQRILMVSQKLCDTLEDKNWKVFEDIINKLTMV